MLSGHEQGAKHKVCMQMMNDILGGDGIGMVPMRNWPYNLCWNCLSAQETAATQAIL